MSSTWQVPSPAAAGATGLSEWLHRGHSRELGLAAPGLSVSFTRLLSLEQGAGRSAVPFSFCKWAVVCPWATAAGEGSQLELGGGLRVQAPRWDPQPHPRSPSRTVTSSGHWEPSRPRAFERSYRCGSRRSEPRPTGTRHPGEMKFLTLKK